jgi:Got1/Sft2-like family
MSLQFSDARKIGIGLTAFGLAFTVLGVVLLFDKGLLAMGNVLFLSGVCLIIGLQRSVRFFFQRKKARGSIFFFVGMALVLVGFPVVGVLLEGFGFINLFGDFFPVAVSFMRRMPVVGNMLSAPPIKRLADRIAGTGGLPV